MVSLDILYKLQPVLADGIVLIDGSSNDVSPDPSSFLATFLKISIGLGIAISVLLVAIGGYKMVMSGGDSKKVIDGKEQITNAILGLILIIAAATITNMILKAFGVENVLSIN